MSPTASLVVPLVLTVGVPAVLPVVVAVAAGASACGLALRSPPRLAGPGPSLAVPDERSLLQRHRLSLSLLAMVGVTLFVGGSPGLVGGPVAGVLAWRVLGRVESPAVARRRALLAYDLPGAVDLLVAAFASGAAPGPALGAVGRALGGPVGDLLGAVHRRLELGADPAEVWRDLSAHPQLGPLGRALGRAHESGASVTVAAQRLTAELRERTRAEVETRARSVSTRAAAPLGVCFLPAFVLLGVVPLVASLVRSMGLLG